MWIIHEKLFSIRQWTIAQINNFQFWSFAVCNNPCSVDSKLVVRKLFSHTGKKEQTNPSYFWLPSTDPLVSILVGFPRKWRCENALLQYIGPHLKSEQIEISFSWRSICEVSRVSSSWWNLMDSSFAAARVATEYWVLRILSTEYWARVATASIATQMQTRGFCSSPIVWPHWQVCSCQCYCVILKPQHIKIPDNNGIIMSAAVIHQLEYCLRVKADDWIIFAGERRVEEEREERKRNKR